MEKQNNEIRIKGAREHNLKNVDLTIPKNEMIVFTGVSGSGKSSLAYDTIYAEGQRRYVESLSTYARQFLGVMEKPDVDLIEGLSPAISIDQKTTSKNPRSTVGTITEIYDYMRLLYARIGHPHCPVCGREIASQSIEQIVENIIESIKTNQKKLQKYMILSPIVRDKKGEFSSLFDNLKAKGFSQVRIDGIVKDISDDFVLIKTNKHNIQVIVDKISVEKDKLKDNIYEKNLKSRITDSAEQALKLSEGLVMLGEILDKTYEIPEKPKEIKESMYSERFACPQDNISLPEIEPRSFSFNSPHGACKECGGIGNILKVEPETLFAKDLTITEGAIIPFSSMFEHDTWYSRILLKVCEENGIDPRIPLKNISEDKIDLILYGTGERTYYVNGTNRQGSVTTITETFPGIIAELEKRHSSTESDWVRGEIEKFMRENICPSCNGTRLKKEALSVTINKRSISDITKLSIKEAIEWFDDLSKNTDLNEREKNISYLILKEIVGRLKFLIAVGVDYLTLDRPAGTLSGGESQRIRLASQIGSGLTGVLYVLDEPTIGLHAKDNQMLIDTLKNLRDLGNTIIVVEHDREMIKQSDYVVDFGPGAGSHGGKVVYNGPSKDLYKEEDSITGKYLSGKKKISFKGLKNIQSDLGINGNGRSDKKSLKIIGANQFNLKNINVDFPLGKLVVITGVSGSGKSTLLVDVLYKAIKNKISSRYKEQAGEHRSIEGVENIDKVILIDQSPIGRTPRSNPATYTKVFDDIRDVFANLRESKTRGYKKGRFSFNVKGGRCEECQGQGQNKIEMQFMSDIWINCEQCNGKRYNSQTLEIDYKGKNISDILDMTVEDALEFFHNHPQIIRKLETLKAVGLGYIELGQPATTLSGGEAQRVKLATELSKKATGDTVYILDEPTTGLHFADLDKLLKVLKLLAIKGNSVFLIEHNMDIIKNADWIIDLGPGGGDEGGYVIAEGTPEEIKKVKISYTGKYLSKDT
ncbi:excinuclease ABC subunit UvrA [Candidatus Woesebacteria bacterium]|nr:excinuclease ABC subunit UvrA [Candidatus Woesebacteria bacterium]